MKAAVYHGPRDIRVEEVNPPEAAENEILIQVKACGICGSDLHTYRLGLFEDALGRPSENGRILGHEMSGEVAKVGSSVEGFRVGDRVSSVGRGGFAEYTTVEVREQSPHHLPESIGFHVGAMMEPFATSIHGVGLSDLLGDETVVVQGVGIIGLGCVQLIRATTDCQIIAVDASSRRLDLASQLGAHETVNLTETDPVEAVIELTGGAKPVVPFGARGGNADVVIDCAGAVASPNQGLLMLKQMYGRLVFVALFEGQPDLDFNQVVRKHVTVRGSWGWTGDDYREAIRLVDEGVIDRAPLISHTFSLDEAPEAFMIQDRPDAAIKVLLKP